MELDARVRECTTLLNEKGERNGGDLIALEARYHGTCLTMLYRRAEYARQENVPEEEKPQRLEGVAMAEVVTFIEESQKTGAGLPTIRLADLAKIYTSALEQLGITTTAKFNTYHLKERIVHQVHSLEYLNKGHDVYLVFREDVGNMLQKGHKDLDDEGMHLAKAAAIIRKDVLGNKYSFNGSFDENCQVRSVPQSLLSFLKMILLDKTSTTKQRVF